MSRSRKRQGSNKRKAAAVKPFAPPVAPLAVNVDEGARMLRISRAFVYELIKRGELKTFRIGKRRLMRVATLDDFLREREGAADQEGIALPAPARQRVHR